MAPFRNKKNVVTGTARIAVPVAVKHFSTLHERQALPTVAVTGRGRGWAIGK